MTRQPFLSHVMPRLPSTDLARTIAFYRDALGLEIDVLWPDDTPTFVILKRDGVRVGFFTPDEHRPAAPSYAELYIEVSGSVDLQARISRHVAIKWGPEVYSYGRREFAVRDPDGYLVIITEPTDAAATTLEPA